jgi:hypothetical protein
MTVAMAGEGGAAPSGSRQRLSRLAVGRPGADPRELEPGDQEHAAERWAAEKGGTSFVVSKT